MSRCYLGSLAALVSIHLLCPFAAPEQPVTIKTITDAWANREDRLRSGRISWVESRTIPKGAISDGFAHEFERARKTGSHLDVSAPPQDTTLDLTQSFSFDGAKVRYAGHLPLWSMHQQRFVSNPVVYVFDEKKGKFLFEGSSASHADGKVTNSNPIDSWYSLIPIVMTFRPSNVQMQLLNVPSLTVTGRAVSAGGKPCVELAGRRGPLIQHVLVDPSKDFAVVR